MKDIFISYSSTDKDVAEDLGQMFARNSWDCFLAHRDIIAGDDYAGSIVEAIDGASLIVLIMSHSSNSSQHVLREVERAVNQNLPIIVYFIDDVTMSKSMEYFVKTQQWIARDENQKERLLCGIQAILSRKAIEKKLDAQGKNIEIDINNISANKTSNKYRLYFLIAVGIILILVVMLIVTLVTNSGKSSADLTSGSVDNGSSNDVPGTNASGSDSSDTDGSGTAADSSSVDTITYELGDTVVLGSFNDEPIEWRVLHFNEDGTAVLISTYCISIKPFDTPEGGKYNEYEGIDYSSSENHIVTDPELNALIRGNNDWSKSNLRTWLNADTEKVNYTDQAPTYAALGYYGNYYAEDEGFLFTWTEAEKSQLILTENLTKANEISTEANEDGYVVSYDYVYLLSEAELEWFDEAGFFFYASATEPAAEKDLNNEIQYNINNHNTDTIQWWLRDPVTDVPEGVGTRVLLVPRQNRPTGDELIKDFCTAGSCVTGVRPAITVDLSKFK